MNKNKLLALVLCLALAVSIVSPATVALAADPYHVDDDTEIIGGGGHHGGSDDSYKTGNDTYVISPDVELTVENAEALYEELAAYESEGELWDALQSLTDRQWELLELIAPTPEAMQYLRDFAAGERPTIPEAPEDGTDTPEYSGVGPLMDIPEEADNSAPTPRRSALRAIMPYSADPDSPTEPTKGLLTSKTVSVYDAEKEIFAIDLKAEAESNIVVTSTPCDIVLVLDVSGSMDDKVNGKQKIADLKLAVSTFIDTVYQNSPNSRIAIVPYASDVRSSGVNQWRGLTTVTGNVDTLKGWVNGLSTGGGTYSDAGLSQATKILQGVSTTDPNYNNARAVILFTDGIPGSGSWDSNNSGDTAQDSMHWSTVLKADRGTLVNVDPEQGFYGRHGDDFATKPWFSDWKLKDGMGNQPGCGATVYTVGLGLPNNDVKINEYMYRVSSHRSDSSHVSNWGNGGYYNNLTRNQTNGYYLTTEKSEELEKIFSDIAQQMGQSIKDAVIRDYLSPYFQLVTADGDPLGVGDTFTTDGKTGTVKSNSQGIYIEWTDVDLVPEGTGSGGQNEAQKFDGTIYVQPKEEFFGGNAVPTNLYGPSGVYDQNGNCVGSFNYDAGESPKVDVIIKYQMAAKDQTIYLGNKAELKDLLDYASGYKPDGGFNNDYVNITYTLKQGGTTVGTYTINSGESAANGAWSGGNFTPALTGCTGYTLSCTVEPTKDAASGSGVDKWSASKTPTVHVLQPTVDVTMHDTTKYYGENIEADGADAEATATAVNWADATTGHTTIPAASGNKPFDTENVTFTYAFKDFSDTVMPNEDVTVQTTAVLKDGAATKDLPEGTTVNYKTTCTVTGHNCTGRTDGTYLIHPLTCTLDVAKDLNGSYDGKDTFIFHVKGEGTNSYNMDVDLTFTLRGGDTKTIVGLPVGTYTVTEESGWSWRYTSSGGGAVHLTAQNPGGSSQITNTLEKTKWLSDAWYVENCFTDTGIKQKNSGAK